jgi:electron transport complex protein RnfG
MRATLLATVTLALFAAAGAGLITGMREATHDAVTTNERQRLLGELAAVLPPALYDNDPTADTLTITAAELGTTQPVTVYRARHAGRPVALALTSIAPDGYNGPIRLLIGIRADGALLGVRVTAHRETPGLGDPIELRRSDWVLGFDAKSSINPQPEQWKVRRDGGVFDQFTGATITPRAVVKAVHGTLLYFAREHVTLFSTPHP